MNLEQLPDTDPQYCFSELFATRQLLVPRVYSWEFATKIHYAFIELDKERWVMQLMCGVSQYQRIKHYFYKN